MFFICRPFGVWSMLAAAALAGGPARGGQTAGLDWQREPFGASAALTVPTPGKTGFTRLPPEVTGISFTNLLAQSRHLTNQILLNGSGVALGDVDGDGWCDVYLCGLDGSNGLYRNQGQWHFEDTAVASGVDCPGLDATGAAFADLDGDGHLDLIVNSRGGGTHVFFNDGKGHFDEHSPSSPLNAGKGGTSLALADIDGDGYLDLYVANYRTTALMDAGNAYFQLQVVKGKQVVISVDGRPTIEPDLTNRYVVTARGGVTELGEADVLYQNQGGTNFAPVSFTSGAFLDEDGRPLTAPPFDWGLTASFHDLNGDGLPDLYVCNDFETPDRVWINQGHGRFRLLPRLAMRKSSLFSMGVDFADVNRDGLVDFVVCDMLSRNHVLRMMQMGDRNAPAPKIGQIDDRPQYLATTMFLNRGDGSYAEVGQLAGLSTSEWAWSPIFLDVDLDGWEDLLVSDGNERDGRNLDVLEQLRALRAQKKLSTAELLQARRLFPRLPNRMLAFRNRHDLTFEETGKEWGFEVEGVSHGMALADLDNDGDLDLVVNNLNAAAGVYRNDTPAPRVAIRLKGRAPNTAGIGSKLTLWGGPVTQSQEVICGGRYLSCDDPMRVFAAGTATNTLALEVVWRSGHKSLITGLRPNRVYRIDEALAAEAPGPGIAGPAAPPPPEQAAPQHAGSVEKPVFADVSNLLHHTHHETAFDDYARQPLLPKQLSQLGPGLAWCDLDGDGWEDLVIGSGKDGYLAVCHNDGRGGFQSVTGLPLDQPVSRDQTALVAWPAAPGHLVILAGAANYEDGMAIGSCVRQYDLANRRVDDSLPGAEASTGPLAIADVDGDGQLDLFVGGRCLPGRYPEAASSLLFLNRGGRLELDGANSGRLANVGLVSGAVFSDLDGDGAPDLVLACEWGPVRAFHNQAGKLEEVTEALGLAQFKGWWNGVNTGDFDSDGRQDIVASNWGRNTPYEEHRAQPLSIYYGDLNGDGVIQVLEGFYDPSLGKLVPERQLEPMAKAMPFLKEQWQTHRAYGQASLAEILGERFASAKKWDANWLESTVFFNRGNRFEAQALPIEAQFAPAFGVCVADFDGDGNEDLFLAQNFFAARPGTPRYDGGRGLWLRGDGQGHFQAVPGQVSGVTIYGEQRGCAVADFDGDGRVDLVVSQNGGETKLYRNQGAKPGLRVRLVGGAGNPSAVGATLRLNYGDYLGPARELHGGGGYWSQDSAVQVLGLAQPAHQLLIQWPGGKATRVELPPGANEIEVGEDGRLRPGDVRQVSSVK